MKIEQLEQILEIAKTKSINKAAANLFISQSALSISIRHLEEELGCELITRSNRGVSFTNKGNDLLEYAESIYSQIERVKTLGLSDSANKATLAISNMHFRFVNLVATELFNKYKENPFKLIIHEDRRDGIINYIHNKYSEIGVINILDCYKKEVTRQLKNKNLIFRKLDESIPIVIVGRGSPLYHKNNFDCLNPKLLEDYPYIRYSEMDYYHYSDKSRLVGIRRSSGEILLNSRSALFDALESTNGYTIATYNKKAYSHFDFIENTRWFTIENCSLIHEIGWIKVSNSILSPIAREFIDLMSSYFI